MTMQKTSYRGYRGYLQGITRLIITHCALDFPVRIV